MKVSVLGLGGAELGFERADFDVALRLVDSVQDVGINVIDTAECYLESEELLGRALIGRRDRFFVFTKCGHPEGPSAADWRPNSLLASIERSLCRLETDRVDLVNLHGCSEDELRKGEVIAALQTAREKGFTRYIGYSGDGRAARYAITCGAFDALETSISIADQEAIELILPLARSERMGVIAKRPIANAAWRYAELPPIAYHRTYWERLRALDYDFLKGDVLKSVPQQAASIALRFTLGVPGVCTAVVGTTRPTRARENAQLVDADSLPTQEFEAIRARWREVAGPDWVGQN